MFPNLKNKKFHDLVSGRLISVIDQFEDVAILDGKQRINIGKLMDNSLYEEYIDPNIFFNSGSLQTLADKIRSIPNEVISSIKEEAEPRVDPNSPFQPVSNESAVLPYDPEEEKMELLRKAQMMSSSQNNLTQIDKFRGLLDEDEVFQSQPVIQQPIQHIDTNQETRPQESRSDVVKTEEVRPQVVSSSVMSDDPISRLFKNIKRKNDFEWSLTRINKIPRADFIEMMEDSYEHSLIDYLAEEFTTELFSDRESIKQMVKEQIMNFVYKDKTHVSESSQETETSQQLKIKTEPKTKSKKKNDTSVAD